MTDTEVREARAADAQAIQSVARASWHAAYDGILGPETVSEYVTRWFDPERLVTDDIRPDDRPLFVAAGTDIVGFAECTVSDDEGELYRLYVHPDHWGRGIGTALLDRVERALRERNLSQVRLSVLAANEVAVRFYEARGFERVAETDDEEFDGVRYEYVKPL